MKKVLIIDTCILCVYLGVPDMDDCGSDDDKWNYTRVENKIKSEIDNKSTFWVYFWSNEGDSNIMRIIKARSSEVKNKWFDFFGKIHYFC